MYTVTHDTPHPLGLHPFKGSNRGHFYSNERTTTSIDEQGNGKTLYVYDVTDVDNVSQFSKVKNAVIGDYHSDGDEFKILRKTLAKLLSLNGLADSPDFAEFKAYNDFANSI